MCRKSVLIIPVVALGILASAFTAYKTAAQSTQGTAAVTPAHSGSGSSSASGSTTTTPGTSPYHPDRFAGRAHKYYELIWGVDSLSVKYTESGEVIRFSYRVLDPAKAKALNEKKNEPSLIDPKAGVKLVVPSLEKVGQLRQSSTPEAGRSYWMAFSNKGRLVKKGDHIDIVIGPFQAKGLVVD